MVFSSIGDTTRSSVSPLQNAAPSRFLATRILGLAASGASSIARSLFATVFPADCRLCGSPLTNISRLPVCPDCIGAIVPITGPTCAACGEGLSEIASAEQLRLCGVCKEALPPYKKASAYGAYDGELRELIHLLKYDQVLPAASVLGKMLTGAVANLGLMGPVLVVPVPLHRSKRRERRFNQAELIARSALTSLHDKRFTLSMSVLQRVRPTVSQIGLTRPQRQENLRGAFKVAHLNRVKGCQVLLVDDVMTTGTTAAECARVLRRAGAGEVWVATVARTLKTNIAAGSMRSEAPQEFAWAVNQ